MILTPAWNKLRPHAKQRILYGTKAKFPVIPAGRGSGKTEIFKRFLVRNLPIQKLWSDPRYFYAAPTERQAKRIAWDHFIALIPKDWVSKINRSELFIETDHGTHKSRIYVIGMDHPQRIEGTQYDGGGLDECSDIKPKTFELSILPALAHRNGFCWRFGIPKRQGVGAKAFKEAYEKALASDDPDSLGLNWPSSDIIPREALEYAAANLDSKDFKEQYGGMFVTSGGGVFYSFDKSYNVRRCTYDLNRTVVVGSDFNINPMAWAFGHYFENRIEWFNELHERDCNTERALNITYERFSNHKGGFIFMGDATGRARKTSASESDYIQILNDKRFDRLGGKSIHYPDANPPKADRFASCNAMLRNALGETRMFIDPCCEHLIADFEDRYYKEGTNEPADTGDLGHPTDAVGYVIHGLFPLSVVIDEQDSPVIIRKRA